MCVCVDLYSYSVCYGSVCACTHAFNIVYTYVTLHNTQLRIYGDRDERYLVITEINTNYIEKSLLIP